MASIIQSLKSKKILAPILGASADVAVGSIMIPGVTAETNLGVLIGNTTSSIVDAIGVLAELHDYSESGDALVDGSVPWFSIKSGNTQMPARNVEIADAATLVRLDYDLTATITVASSSGVTPVITSLEDNIDTSWLYVNGGTALGQIQQIITSASGSCTIYAAFSPALAASDTVVKVLRLFHNLLYLSAPTATVPTKISSTAAAGACTAMVLENHLVRNGYDELLNPKAHAGLTALDKLAQFGLYAVVALQNSGFHPID